MSYSLIYQPNVKLEAQAHRIIDDIVADQKEDGYHQTYFTPSDPDKKGTDVSKREDYQAGHLFEEAFTWHLPLISEQQARMLLVDTAMKLSNRIKSYFIPAKRNWVLRHQRIEQALNISLQEPNEVRYWEPAYWILEVNSTVMAETITDIKKSEDAQDNLPIRDYFAVTGHGVRTVCMFAGMTDIANNEGRPRTFTRFGTTLWQQVNKSMDITSAIGVS